MSLIEEALRRVQELPRPVERTEGWSAPRPAPSQVDRPRLSQDAGSPAWWPSHVQWLVVGAVGALVVGWGIWTLVVLLNPPAPVQPQPVSRPAQQSHEASRRPFASLAARPSLQLSGVVTGPGEPMAIINGHLLKIGETIEGATLLEVTDTSARVHWRDQEFVLRLAR